jgi:hypothetical protein
MMGREMLSVFLLMTPVCDVLGRHFPAAVGELAITF